ncbi:thiamine-phosphate diphosphorylase [Bradyrhizobium sp. LB13.1]
MPYPDPFYPVVDSLAWVERLTKLGVGTIQLRAKDLDDSQALQIVSDALAITNGTPAKLVVNDYWRAAIVAGAKYLHLGQEDLADADLKSIREAGLSLGVSTHDEAELETALAAKPDYVALGPIFFTTLKSMRFDAAGHSKDPGVEEAHRPHPAGRDRRHQVRAGRGDLCGRRGFHRRRQRRHPECRPGCAGAAMARPGEGGGVMLHLQSLPHTPPSSPGLTGRSSTPRLLGSSRTASEYWIPAPVRNCALGGDDSGICLSRSDANELTRRIP